MKRGRVSGSQTAIRRSVSRASNTWPAQSKRNVIVARWRVRHWHLRPAAWALPAAFGAAIRFRVGAHVLFLQPRSTGLAGGNFVPPVATTFAELSVTECRSAIPALPFQPPPTATTECFRGICVNSRAFVVSVLGPCGPWTLRVGAQGCGGRVQRSSAAGERPKSILKGSRGRKAPFAILLQGPLNHLTKLNRQVRHLRVQLRPCELR